MKANMKRRMQLQSMATDMRRLNMTLAGEEQAGSSKLASSGSPSMCSMQTERDSSNGCASPAISDCFNPFDCPSVHSRDSPRLPLGGGLLLPCLTVQRARYRHLRTPSCCLQSLAWSSADVVWKSGCAWGL